MLNADQHNTQRIANLNFIKDEAVIGCRLSRVQKSPANSVRAGPARSRMAPGPAGFLEFSDDWAREAVES
jgi:hypothetical protein